MKSNKRFLLVALALLLATLLISGLALADDPVAPTKLTLSMNPKTSLKLEGSPSQYYYFATWDTEDTKALKVAYEPATASLEGLKFKWTSSNEDVASFSNNYSEGSLYKGLNVKAPGETTVTVTMMKDGALTTVKGEIKLAFTEVPVTGIVFDQDEYKLNRYSYYDMAAHVTVNPDTATYGSDYLTWSSSDSAIATIDKYGELYAKKAGTVTITAKSKDGKVSKAVSVTVKEQEITGLEFTQSEFSMEIHEDLDLWDYLVVTPYTTGTFKWVSSDINVATVSGGTVEAKKPGTATITVTPQAKPELAKSVTVTVTAKNATAVAFKQAAYVIDQGDTLYLDDLIQRTPFDANYKNITFSTSNRDIVELYNGTGYGAGHYADAKKPGTVTLTVTVKNYDDTTVTNTCTLEVKSVAVTSFAFEAEAYEMLTSDDYLDLNRRLIIKPDDRDWINQVFDDDKDALIWTTSDQTVATVAWGHVYPVAPGTATITVTYGYNAAITKSVPVTVKAVPVTGVKLSKTSYTADPNEVRSDWIIATIEPADAYVKETYWKSSNRKVAFVSNSGESVDLYTNEAGKATLTFYVDDGTTVHEASVEVTVIKDSGALQIKKSGEKGAIKSLTLGLQKTKKKNENIVQLIAFSDDTEYNKNEVTWKSSSTKVATVDKYGRITVKKEGSAKITATLKDGSGKSATLKVNVKKNLIKSIKGNKTITLRVGESTYLYGESGYGYIVLTPKYEDLPLFSSKLTYKSSKADVASVNSNGLVVANSVGKAKITVKANDGSKKSFVITVNVVKEMQ
jgi:uncharacterized protein YjdB